MSISQIPPRKKKVPKLYETDASKYAGPHRLQQSWMAKLLRQQFKHYAYTQFANVFTEIEVNGLGNLSEVTGPCIFIGNHTSHLDTILTQTALPNWITANLFYGAAQDRWFVKGRKKKELNPLYQSFILGTFPIQRGGGIDALSYASELLEAGKHIFLFPEGTRAVDGMLGDFKHGAGLLALRHQVPVVPLYLSGLADIRPKGSKDSVPGPVGLDILKAQKFAKGTDVVSVTSTLQDMMNHAHVQRTTPDAPRPNKVA